MEKRMNVMGRQSLAALKYLIETGREYRGDYAIVGKSATVRYRVKLILMATK